MTLSTILVEVGEEYGRRGRRRNTKVVVVHRLVDCSMYLVTDYIVDPWRARIIVLGVLNDTLFQSSIWRQLLKYGTFPH
jgi:hypothetical protein